jgi:hypothetical protein
MAINQFADISKDLSNQIKFIESTVRDDLFKEAARLLSAAEETCLNLESAMVPDNQVQTKIVSNRRLEIHWLHDEIQLGLTKKPVRPVKRRKTTRKPG